VKKDLAEIYGDAGNDQEALRRYRLLIEEEPDSYEIIFKTLLILKKKEDPEEVLRFLEFLRQSKDQTTGYDRQTQLFHAHHISHRYHDNLAAIGREPVAFDVIKNGYQTAVDAAELRLKLAEERLDEDEEDRVREILRFLMYFSALFLYDNHSCEEQKQHAISLWASLLRLSENRSDWYISWLRWYVVNKLADIYLQKALSAKHGSKAAGEYLELLEQLASSKVEEDLEDRRSQKFPKLLLARYYSIRGEDTNAKQTLRAYVKVYLDLLSDEDPKNDWQGYLGLSKFFMFAGQDDDALAAWSLIKPNDAKTEDTTTNNGPASELLTDGLEEAGATSTIAETTQVFKGPLGNTCDGECGTSWKYANDIYVCRECYDVQFDERCLKKLREGTLECRVCNKDHEMLHVPKYDQKEVDAIGEGNVKVGQKIMKVEEWIKGIKKDWEIPE
jgi:hypothetical protein